MHRVILCALVLALTGCAIKTLDATTRPAIGWSAQRVESTLGLSHDVTALASGYEVWRYGVDNLNWISGGCTSRYTIRCMHVYVYQGRVVDILWP